MLYLYQTHINEALEISLKSINTAY